MPTFAFTCSTLLRVPNKPIVDILASTDDDSLALGYQCGEHNRSRKPSKWRCEYCHKHYALHGHPSQFGAIVQNDPPLIMFFMKT